MVDSLSLKSMSSHNFSFPPLGSHLCDKKARAAFGKCYHFSRRHGLLNITIIKAILMNLCFNQIDRGANVEIVRSIISERGSDPWLASVSVEQVWQSHQFLRQSNCEK